MGRLDDALRRAGVPQPQAAAAASAEAPVVFVSPWETPANTDTRAGTADAARFRKPEHEDPNPAAPLSLSAAWSHVLVSSAERSEALAEQFGRLAGKLHALQATQQLKTAMVTSAAPGEGKTLTAMNLALILSGSYRRRVLLIDADLRRPSIGEICQLSDRPGLAEGLRGRIEQKLPVVQLTDMLTVLPAGQPDPDPVSGLTSDRMQRILDEAASRFDWIILDTAPTGVAADASLLAGMVDAVLFVVRIGATPYDVIQRSLDGLGRERIFGVVLNGIDEKTSLGYSPYYYSSAR